MLEKYIERGYNEKLISLARSNPYLLFDLSEQGKSLLSYVIEKNNMGLLRKLVMLPKVDLDILDSRIRCPANAAINFKNREALIVIFVILDTYHM